MLRQSGSTAVRIKSRGRKFRARLKFHFPILFSGSPLESLNRCASAKCHNGSLSFCRWGWACWQDAMNIPDYVAIALLLMMLLAALLWFSERKFEL